MVYYADCSLSDCSIISHKEGTFIRTALHSYVRVDIIIASFYLIKHFTIVEPQNRFMALLSAL